MLLTIYSCNDAIKRLDDYLDRELSSTELVRVERHVKLCQSCSKKFKFEKETLDGIRAKFNRIILPIDIYERIEQLLELESGNKDNH